MTKLISIEDLVEGLKSSVSDIREVSCREIIRRYSGLIQKITRSLTSRPELADDIFQESFLRLFLKIDLLKEPKAFPGFFRSIIVSTAYDLLRKEAKHVSQSISKGSLAQTIDRQFMDQLVLVGYLPRLGKDDRLIVESSFFLGLSDQEIASRLGVVSAEAVRMRRSRALSALRRMIARDAKALKALS